MLNKWILVIFNCVSVYFWTLLLCDKSLARIYTYDSGPELFSRDFIFNISMPDIQLSLPESYLCTAKKLSSHEQYIVNFEPHVDSRRSHHMLLFGCGSLYPSSHLYPRFWDCRYVHLCDKMTIMYGWAKDAPPMSLPQDVGFRISGNSSINYLVLQVHYANKLPDGVVDDSGISLHVTTKTQRYVAGIYLLSSREAVIPPHNPKVHVDINCVLQSKEPLHMFAYRVHAHKLGKVITGYKYTFENNSWTQLAKGNPHWPQAFYPMDHIYTIRNNEVLAARCTYDSSHVNTVTQIGSNTNDEMCNLYLMYYTSSERGQTFYHCIDTHINDLSSSLPKGNDGLPVANSNFDANSNLPSADEHPITYNRPWTQNAASFAVDKKGLPLAVTPQHLYLGNELSSFNYHNQQWDGNYDSPTFNPEFKYSAVEGWPSGKPKFGQITAVTLDNQGNVVLFHRGSHVWNSLTFDLQEKYLPTNQGPISVPTVVTLDSATGHIVNQWGSNLFFLPHGLTIDSHNFIWLTDVALHQVFKFSPKGGTQPLMTLGTRFIPGDDDKHFCKPTSVAVCHRSGEIYVADGYCNSRIVRFTSEGVYSSQWGKSNEIGDRNPPPGALSVAHKVVLVEDKNMICVADRENGRIQCFTLVNGHFQFEIIRREFDGKLFSIDYSSLKGGLLYAVCGESLNPEHMVQAFVFNFTSHVLLNTFVPKDGTFTRPHDIAVSADTNDAYVVEIGPNTIWKFSLDHHKSTKKVLKGLPPTNSSSHNSSLFHTKQSTVDEISHQNSTQSNKAKKFISNIGGEANNFGASMIIMALLGLPVLILILVTVIIRLKKRGKLHNCSFGHLKGWLGGYRTPGPQEKFNLGNLLNPHKGFDRVALEESDVDGEEGSDSDIEEFNAATRKA